MTSERMTLEKLARIYGEASPRAAAKVIYKFDRHSRSFIEHSTFLVLATSGDGGLDVSPKGDPAGFVKVESDQSLLIPDRPGNNRIDSLKNIVENPNIALLFMIPSVSETLRVNGTAQIVDTTSVLNQFEIKGNIPKTVIRVNASEIYTHCGKAPIRSGLWNPKTWPDSRPVPTLFEMIRDHAELPSDSVDQASVDKSYQKSLY